MLIGTILILGFMLGGAIHPAVPRSEFPLPQAGSAALIVILMQALKAANRFPWLKQNAGRMGVWFSAMLSVLAGAGIHAGLDMRSGTLTVTGLTLVNLQGLLADAFQVWTGSETMYKWLFQRKATP